LTVACTECVEALSSCTHGRPHLTTDYLIIMLSVINKVAGQILNSMTVIVGLTHDFVSLDDLVIKLSKDMEKLTLEMLDRENKLSGLFKCMTGILCDYDSETRDMIETLHRTRDEQVICTAFRLEV